MNKNDINCSGWAGAEARPYIFRITGRRDGHLREPRALARFLKKGGWPAAVATGEQVHRAKIAVVPALSARREYAGVDGLITDAADQPLGLFTADCVPVFVSGDQGRVVGVLHAGWRGVQARLVPLAIRLLKRRWGISADAVQLWAGPCICVCCFEVRWDVARYFPGARRRAGDRWRVDLIGALEAQVARAGARWIGEQPVCTMHTKQYFSFRRDATAKRQVSLIMKKGSS